MSVPFLSDIFGSKPEIADYTPIDLTQEQSQALQGNIDNFPKIAEMGNLFQSYLLSAYDKAIPGFTDILKLGGTTTKDMLSTADEFLHGKIPQDVQDSIQRTDAYKTLMSGGGAAFGKSLTARDFGLTSLNLINQGANLAGQAGNAAQRWAALSGAEIPQGMLITPGQKATLDMQQNLIKQATEQTRNNVAAAPDPIYKGLSDIVENLTAAYLGGKVGSIGAGNAAATGAAAPTNWGSNIGQGIGTGSAYGGGAAPVGDFAAPTYLNDQAPLPVASGYGGTSPWSAYGGYGQDYGFSPWG